MKTDTILKKIEQLPMAPRMGRPIKWDRRIIYAAIDAKKRGVPYSHISRLTGISYNVLVKLVRKYDVE